MTTKQEALEALAEIDSFIDGGGPRLERASATLRQFIESAGADSERLDWLDRDGVTHAFKIGNRWYSRDGWGRPHHRATSLRAAIDAALAARSPQPGEKT